MLIRKVLVYKQSEGKLSLEREADIVAQRDSETSDSIHLEGLGHLITDLEHYDTIIIVIHQSRFESHKTKYDKDSIKTNLQKAEKLRFS